MKTTINNHRFPLLKLIWVFAFIAGACTSEIEIDDNNLVLRDGEQLVTIRLNGIGSAAVPVGRALTDDDATTTTGSAAENTIEELTIYSFVGISRNNSIYKEGLQEATIDYFTLERVYHYKTGSNNNDILLTADGNGYSVAIPVASDKYYRKFAIKANAGAAADGTVAVPVGEDRTNATELNGGDSWEIDYTSLYGSDILSLETIDVSGGVAAIRPPLPAAGFAFWNEELTGGYVNSYTEFTAADLARGLTANLARRVCRFDINNPATTGFTVTGISADNVDNGQCYLFMDSYDSKNAKRVTIATTPLTNATSIPAALYLPTGDNGPTNMNINIHGNLHGVPVSLKAIPTGILKANSRYVINIINSGNNIAANLALAPWNDADSIPSDDLYGKLNAEAELTIARMGDRILLENNVITVLYTAISYEHPYPGIFISGATGNTLPVGIIIPEDVKWLSINKQSENTTNDTYNVTVNIIAENLSRPSEELIMGEEFDKAAPFFSPPRETTLTLVTNKDGKNIYHTYRVVQDWFFPNSLTLPDKLTVGNLIVANGTLHQNTVTLPPFQKGDMYYTGKYAHAGILRDQSWLRTCYASTAAGIDGILNGLPTVILHADDNFYGYSDRSVTLTMRVWDNTLGKVVNHDYTIIQTAGKANPDLLTTGVYIDATKYIENETITVNDQLITIPESFQPGNNIPNDSRGLLLVATDDKGFVASVPPGQDWLWLEAPSGYLLDTYPAHNNKYIRRIRMDANTTGERRSAYIKILYRGSDGNITTKNIEVAQDAGSGTI